MINRILFLFKYAYRNITRNFFRTLTLFLSVTMLAFIVLVAVSIGDAFTGGYSLYKYLKNENVDVEVTFDGNSKSHIVLSDEMVRFNQYIDYYGAFFNIDSTVEINDQTEYVEIISGTTEELNQFIGTDFEHIQYNEVIINSNFSEKYDLQVGNDLRILIGAEHVSYKIVGIASVKGIFGENSIFLQKSAFIKKISNESFDFDLSFIEEDVLLTNRICINLKDNVDKKAFIEALSDDDFYANSLVRDPSDIADYQPVLDIAVGIMYAALAIFIAAMIFVLISIINVRIINIKKEVGIIETFGESKKYMFKVLAIEMVLFSIIGLIIGWASCEIIYKIEFMIFSDYPNYNYPFTWHQLLLTYLTIIAIASICLVISYKNFNKIDTLELSKSQRFETVWSFKKLLIFNIINFSVWGLKFLLKPYMHIKYYSLISIIIVVVCSVSVISLLLKIILKLFKFKQIFSISIGNNLAYNRTKHNSLRILLICLFGIVAAFCVIETINAEISKVENNLDIDYALINVTNYSDEMENELMQLDAVEMVGQANFLQKQSTIDSLYVFEIMFSCEVEKTKSFMNFELPNNVIEEFKNPTKSYIVVTDEFLKANDKQVGDILSFEISDMIIDYEIIAAANVGFQLFAYTNDCYNNKIGCNSVLINTSPVDDAALNEFNILIREKYCSEMVYILNVAAAINNIFSRGKMALNVVYMILVVIIVCFIISIINNTIIIFNEIKTELAILQILGISPSDMNKMVVQEMLISYFVILLPMIFLIITFFEVFGGFSLLFGYYVNLQSSIFTILLAIIVGMFCFGMSYIYYFVGLKKIDVCYELKK